MSTPLRKYLESLDHIELEFIEDPKTWQVENLADRFSVSTDDVRAELTALKPPKENPRWLFEWFAGLNKSHGAGRITIKGFKVGAALFTCSNPSRPYVWPSQETIADLCGWSKGNRRGIFEGLGELSNALGSLERIRFIDLPVNVVKIAEVANGGRKDPRSMAYKFRPVAEWKKGDESPLGKHTYASHVEALNTNTQHQLASPDISHSIGVLTTNLECEDSYLHSMNEGNTTRRTAL